MVVATVGSWERIDAVRNNILVVIPARYASTRLPGKPLILFAGKPMIQHVYERAAQAAVDRVVVATDDERIARAVRDFGGSVAMTSPDHHSGTDRVAEAARQSAADIIINVQGDEPLLDPDSINQAVAPMLQDDAIVMGTLAHPLHDSKEVADPNVVKVVCDRQGFALYFSRSPIPFVRESLAARSTIAAKPSLGMLRHIGLYVYRSDFLQKFANMSPTPLELSESLEQLRALENGQRIRVVVVEKQVMGVDTEEDVIKVRNILGENQT